MDDPADAYTTVEQAQLAMANTTSLPGVRRQRGGDRHAQGTYDGYTYQQEVANSPADQGYHWNRNAKTYLHIGLAMGDAMSTLTPRRCPSRLRAAGGPGGVTLTWQNGTETPTSVQILRNGVRNRRRRPGQPRHLPRHHRPARGAQLRTASSPCRATPATR